MTDPNSINNMVTKEQVKKYMWPHIDFGKEQICAKFLGHLDHKHGDIVEIKFGDEVVRKGVFRLIEANLYTDEFMKAALPLAKEIYTQ